MSTKLNCISLKNRLQYHDPRYTVRLMSKVRLQYHNPYQDERLMSNCAQAMHGEFSDHREHTSERNFKPWCSPYVTTKSDMVQLYSTLLMAQHQPTSVIVTQIPMTSQAISGWRRTATTTQNLDCIVREHYGIDIANKYQNN